MTINELSGTLWVALSDIATEKGIPLTTEIIELATSNFEDLELIGYRFVQRKKETFSVFKDIKKAILYYHVSEIK